MLNKDKKITIKDIARITHVSTATVSRVLNNIEGHCSEDTKKKILDTVKNLNYSPDHFAVSLKSRTSKSIGLIVPEMHSFFSEVFNGAQEVASANSYSLLMANSNYSADLEEKLIKNLKQKRVDGIIITIGLMENKNLKELRKDGMPIVLIERFIEDDQIPAIVIDLKQMTKDAMDHLYQLGHRRIGYISAPLDMVSLIDRHEGYKEFLKLHNIKYDPEIVVIDKSIQKNLLEPGYELIKKIIAKGNLPTAFLIISDTVSIAAIKAFKENGYKIPDDVSIIGFDGLNISAFTDPPLTTITQPRYEMGKKAMEVLLKLIEGKEPSGKDILLHASLTVRNTTAPVKNLN
ncbi:MAG: LacI family transcriptional regulator [Actinobacteria bacterium]|nr:LacI family transcriptional regulator [Actinomycetota bacterium]